jgi:ankyrin repeat protein
MKLASLNLEYSPAKFVDAAMDGDEMAVKLFLDAGMDPNATTVSGHSALPFAVVKGHLPAVSLLLDRGANPNVVTSQGDAAGVTPLMFAVAQKNIEMVKALLQRGADPDVACGSANAALAGDTALMAAVRNGNKEAVSLLLPRIKHINAKNSQGDTAFDVALDSGSTNIQSMLRQAGAVVLTEKCVLFLASSLADKVGSAFNEAGTSLKEENVIYTLTNGLSGLQSNYRFSDEQMAIACKKALDAIENVIRLNALRGFATKSDEEIRRDRFLAPLYQECKARLEAPSAFLPSVWRGDLDKVKAYLTAGADANAKHTNGLSALMFASLYGHTQIARVLIANGAAVDATSPNDRRALMLAKNASVAKLLLDNGAAPDAKDSAGATAIYYAVASDHADVVDVLLMRGGRIDATNSYGRTVLAVAAREGATNSVRWLLDKGADREIRDEKGLTAYDYAERNEHTGIVEMLKGPGKAHQEH